MQRTKEKHSVLRRELHELHIEWYSWWDDDDNYYDDDYYDRYYFDHLTEKTQAAEILDIYLENKEYYNRRIKQENYTPYHIVDMESIFSVSERRERLIDRLLDEEEIGFRRPLFRDLFKDIFEKASN